MKKTLLTILIVFLGLPIIAQDISFPSAIVSAGGGTEDGNPVNLSRWRIGQVHMITIPGSETTLDTEVDWIVFAYPNPVIDFLQLEFTLPETREFVFKITDTSGRVILIQEARTFVNGSKSELDLSSYPPALYLLQITSPDLNSQRTLRIQKL